MKQLDNILGEEIIRKLQRVSQSVNYSNDSNSIFNRDITVILPEDGYIDIFNKLNEYKVTGEELNEFYIIRYKVGDFINKHNDIWDTKRSFKRTRSLVVQLSDPSTYRGGNTIVYDIKDKPYDITKKVDSGMIFASTLNHEVAILEAGVRYSLVACYERGKGGLL